MTKETSMMGGGLKKRRPLSKKFTPKVEPKVEMVEVKRTVGRCGKPPRVVTVKVPKDHPLAKGT